MAWIEIGAEDELEDLFAIQGDVYVGDDYGDDYGDDEIGAVVRQRVNQALARRGMRRGAPPRGSMVPAGGRGMYSPRINRPVARTVNPSMMVEAPLPVDSGATIAAAAQATIFTRPQVVAYKPQALVIGNAIAPSFTVDDVKVGNSSQFMAAGQLPGEVFSNLSAQRVALKGDTAQGGLDVVTQVTNQSGGALRFRATYFGKGLKV